MASGAGELHTWVRSLAVVAEDQGLVLSTHRGTFLLAWICFLNFVGRKSCMPNMENQLFQRCFLLILLHIHLQILRQNFLCSQRGLKLPTLLPQPLEIIGVHCQPQPTFLIIVQYILDGMSGFGPSSAGRSQNLYHLSKQFKRIRSS